MPGLNMLGAMNISPVYGFWRVMPFIAGATFGIALVVVLSITSATTIMAKASYIFDMIKYLGAAFLLYIGYIFWRVSTTISNNKNIYFATGDKSKLIAKGFLTATLNPKAWLFFAVFLLVVFIITRPGTLPKLWLIVRPIVELPSYVTISKNLEDLRNVHAT